MRGPAGGEACGDILEAMARITPSQPNDAMARIASRRNRTISLDPNLPGQNSERGSLDSKEDWARIPVRCDHHHAVTEVHNFKFSLAAASARSSPVVRRLLK